MVKVAMKKPALDLIERKLLLVDPWYQLILKIINPVLHELKGKRILEVGCGLGGFCINIASKGGKVIGLDVSSSAIHSGKKLAKQSGVSSQLDFVIGDAQFLPFKDQTNDLVICSETLEHVMNYEKALCELVRVIDRSGYLCMTVPNLLSTLFFEYVVLLLIGQPQYAKKFAYVEKEHVFHLFKLRRLLNREDIRVVEIRSTDFLHLPPTVRGASKIGRGLKIVSDRMEDYLEAHGLPLRLFGANIGVLARKV